MISSYIFFWEGSLYLIIRTQLPKQLGLLGPMKVSLIEFPFESLLSSTTLFEFLAWELACNWEGFRSPERVLVITELLSPSFCLFLEYLSFVVMLFTEILEMNKGEDPNEWQENDSRTQKEYWVSDQPYLRW